MTGRRLLAALAVTSAYWVWPSLLFVCTQSILPALAAMGVEIITSAIMLTALLRIPDLRLNLNKERATKFHVD